MSILEFSDTEAYKAEWNDFVHATPQGSFFHMLEWKDVLERGFGFQTFYMMEKEHSGVRGILPLALVKRPLFGPALISTPLCVYGGALGVCDDLIDAAVKKAEALGVQYLELRGSMEPVEGYSASDRFYTFRKEISEDHEVNLKAIPRKQRAEVRKGISANLETISNQDIDLFYSIYAQSVRNLGTPVFAKKYLRVLIDVFGDAFDVTTVAHEGQSLTSVLSFYYKDQILPYYGGGIGAARRYSAYPYMYWKLMERAADKGIRVFDFGRSMAGGGAYAFKKNFGFTPEALPYHYHLVKADGVPDMDPDNPRNKFLTSAWKKLPMPIANMVGPILYPIIV